MPSFHTRHAAPEVVDRSATSGAARLAIRKMRYAGWFYRGPSQQSRHTDPIRNQGFATGCNAGPTFLSHWVHVSSLLACSVADYVFVFPYTIRISAIFLPFKTRISYGGGGGGWLVDCHLIVVPLGNIMEVREPPSHF